MFLQGLSQVTAIADQQYTLERIQDEKQDEALCALEKQAPEIARYHGSCWINPDSYIFSYIKKIKIINWDTCSSWLSSEVAQSCLTLCDPMDCSLPGSSFMESSRQEYWIGLPSPGDLPDPRIEPRSPALQTDALPCEPPGKPSWLAVNFYWNVCLTVHIPSV